MWLMWPYLEHGMEGVGYRRGGEARCGSCSPTLNMSWKEWVVDGEGKHDVAHVTLP